MDRVQLGDKKGTTGPFLPWAAINPIYPIERTKNVRLDQIRSPERFPGDNAVSLRQFLRFPHISSGSQSLFRLVNLALNRPSAHTYAHAGSVSGGTIE